jgi:hypothetical protein
MGAKLFYTDRRTDKRTGMTNLIVAFENCANAPKNCWLLLPENLLTFHLPNVNRHNTINQNWIIF